MLMRLKSIPVDPIEELKKREISAGDLAPPGAIFFGPRSGPHTAREG